MVLFVGAALAFIRLLLFLFPFSYLLEALLFFGFGYLFGAKVYRQRWHWGLLLALPTMLMAVYYLLSGGANAVATGIGTRYLASALMAPVAACLGIYIRVKRRHRIDVVDDTLLN